MNDAQGIELPSRHPARPLVARAFWAMLLAAALFDGFAVVTTQVEPLRAHSPWQDDPYDAVVSFTMFFVPIVCGLCVIRVQLFRSRLPLAIPRVRDLLRATGLVLGLIGVTLAADWIGVVAQADRSTWTAATLVLIGMLGLVTGVAALAAAALSIASRQQSLTGRHVPRTPVDWAGDVVAVADQWRAHLGPFGAAAAPLVRWIEDVVLDGRRGVRRHPLWWAGGFAVLFGGLLAAAATREEGPSPVLLLFVGVGSSGMFAFLVIGGSFLGFVRGTAPAIGARRRVIDAATAMAASVPVALAFRDSLWWVVGSSGGQAGLASLAALLTVLGAAVFLAVLAAETGFAIHSPR